jgi:hypothetical protein
MNLRDIKAAINLLKELNPDGKVVGQDSVSGDAYFENFISIGTIYKSPNGKMRVIADAIFYPTHYAKSGRLYGSEVRFISYAFDPVTLDIDKNDRKNIGYNYLINKCDIINTSVSDYIRIIEGRGKPAVISLD